MIKKQKQKVVIYGGNGFVGTHAAQSITHASGEAVCVSRTGHKPIHLKDQGWSNEVRWCKGDASKPCQELLQTADSMVCVVGSAPLPTWSHKAREAQFFSNGTACINAIEGAHQAGIKRIVLVNAQIPWPLRTERFAYFKGKMAAKMAAETFSQYSNDHSAVVLLPGMITGKRALKNGRFVRLDLLTAPVSPIMPWQFVAVERIASTIALAALNHDTYPQAYTEVSNREINMAETQLQSNCELN